MSVTEIKEILQNCLDRAVAENEVAGCTFCLTRNGEEKLYLESGYADRETEKPIARDSMYRMYSMSKPVTAAAAMKLVEDGYVDLQDPVFRYLPAYRKQYYMTPGGALRPVSADSPMRVRDLLNMTSGFVYPDDVTRPGKETGAIYEDAIRRLGTDNAMTTQEFAERIGECALLFEPGSSWNYSVSADILGAVIEKISGMSFGEYLKENILDPVGMEDTAFYVPDEKKSRLVTAYMNREDQPGAELVPYTGNHLAIRNDGGANPFESGGAGLFSTLDDYRKFTGMLMNHGKAENGKQVLRPGTVRFFSSGKLSSSQQKGFDSWGGLSGHTYANLNRVMVDPDQAVTIGHKGEYGWDGWLGVYFANDPQVHQTILLMMNKKDYGTDRLTREIRNIVNSETE